MDGHQHNIHLLVVSPSSNDGNRLISALRDAGVSLRAAYADRSEVLSEQLKERWDVLVCYPSALLDINQLLKVLARHDQQIPSIVVSNDTQLDLLALYQQGIRHVAHDGTDTDLTQLMLSVMREAQSCQHARQLRQLELQYQELIRRHDLLLDDSVAAYSYLQDGMHLYCNTPYARLFGFDSADAVRIMPLLNLVIPEDRDTLREIFAHDTLDTQSLTLHAKHPDDSEHALLLRFTPVEYQGKSCMLLAVQPAAGNTQYQDQIDRLQSQDLLTRLDNPATFNRRLETAIRQAVQKHEISALVILEVADFADISHSLGKASANILLNDIAQYLLQHVALPHTVARLAEAEFGLLLHAADPDQVLALSERLRSGFNGRISSVMPASLELNCSLGVTMINAHTPNANDTVARARHNLKQQLSDPAPSYSFRIGESMEHDATTMLDYLQVALQEQRFRLVYQPIVHIKGSDHLGYEVLIRMLDSDGNEVPPGAFIPLANLNGIGEDLDRVVINRVLQTLQGAPEGLRLILNITSNTLMSQAFLPWLSEQLQLNRSPADRLIIELSEIDIHKSLQQAMHFCRGLEELGLSLSVSHFGCALDPFSILNSIKPTFLKLDETLVRDIIYSTQQKEKVRNLIQQIHQHQLLVVTPQVEDMDVLPVLWEVGADYAQGYCLQAPSNEMNYEFMTEEEITLTASQH